MTSRRAQNRLEKERRILDAALRVFADHGYTAATMDLIADAAGLTKPTLYQYFPSKDKLFTAMLTVPRERMLDAFEGDAARVLVDQLYEFAWTYADTVMQPEFLSLARLIIGEAQRFPEIGTTYQASGPDRLLQGLIVFMEAQRRAGRLRFEDPELAAQDFWGLILSAPRNKALYEPDAVPGRAAVARYVHNGIAVFLRAYATDPERDLERLTALVKHHDAIGAASARPQPGRAKN